MLLLHGLITRVLKVTQTRLRDETPKARLPRSSIISHSKATKFETDTSFLSFQRSDLTRKTMSVVKENWQTTRPTIRERSKFMFNNNLFSDVKFVVQKASQSEGESKVSFKKICRWRSEPP